MSVYAVGDIQGCYSAFCRLLDRIAFDPGRDRLWLVGDLVNRGGRSLQVLRRVYELRESVACVLGNHDLHLLAAAERYPDSGSGNAEFDAILAAPDSRELLDWLLHRPLLHSDAALDWLMVHAGIPPDWDLDRARRLAARVATALRGSERGTYLRTMYGNSPERWRRSLDRDAELRVITNALTRMRFCDADGRMSFGDSGPPGSQRTPGHRPWFEWPQRIPARPIVFGHWSALGAYDQNGVVCLDSGCVWGGPLTAMRLDGDRECIQVSGGPG